MTTTTTTQPKRDSDNSIKLVRPWRVRLFASSYMRAVYKFGKKNTKTTGEPPHRSRLSESQHFLTAGNVIHAHVDAKAVRYHVTVVASSYQYCDLTCYLCPT